LVVLSKTFLEVNYDLKWKLLRNQRLKIERMKGSKSFKLAA